MATRAVRALQTAASHRRNGIFWPLCQGFVRFSPTRVNGVRPRKPSKPQPCLSEPLKDPKRQKSSEFICRKTLNSFYVRQFLIFPSFMLTRTVLSNPESRSRFSVLPDSCYHLVGEKTRLDGRPRRTGLSLGQIRFAIFSRLGVSSDPSAHR